MKQRASVVKGAHRGPVEVQMPEKKVGHLVRAKARTTIQKEAATYEAGIAAMMGINTKAIMARTGLRAHQVAYRLQRTGASVVRRDYRNGQGPVADFLLSKARRVAEEEFVELLRKNLQLPNL